MSTENTGHSAPNPQHAQLLQIAREAAWLGANQWKNISRKDIHTFNKGESGDIATQVDRETEVLIKDFISKKRTDVRIVGEEFGAIGPEEARFHFSIDPIDGTSNFMRGLPHVATSIGVKELHQDGSFEWVAGSIVAGYFDTEYFASKNAGAWVSRNNTKQRLSGPVNNDGGPRLYATGVSYDPSIRLQQFSDFPILMNEFDDLRAIGSAALGMCLVAEGGFTAFDESDLYEYDWAAGAIIAKEAGLIVTVPTSERGRVQVYPDWIEDSEG